MAYVVGRESSSELSLTYTPFSQGEVPLVPLPFVIVVHRSGEPEDLMGFPCALGSMWLT